MTRYELKNEIRQSMSESPRPDLDDYVECVMNAIDKFDGGKSK